MKNVKMISAALIIMLSMVVFGMSGDGGNVPVVPNKESVNAATKDNVPVTQSENIAQSSKSSTVDTVKDRLGVDTGMSKEKFEGFKTSYIKKAEKIGIQDHSSVSPQSYFDHKINLGVIEDLKNLGLFLTCNPRNFNEIYSYSITHADIILIGTIDSVEYLYKTEDEEIKVPASNKSRYFVKLDKVIKGAEYYKNIPEKVTYLSTIGKFITSSGDYKLKIGQKYVLFFQIQGSTTLDLVKIRQSSLRIEGEKIYQEYFNDYFKSFDEVLFTIEKYVKTNDSENFYLRVIERKENQNEK